MARLVSRARSARGNGSFTAWEPMPTAELLPVWSLTTATFTVDQVKSYPKTDFPTELVYGPSRTAGLRVVTCGGQFDQSSGSYLNNVIAFATMTP